MTLPVFAEIAEQARALDIDAKEQLVAMLRAWLVEERRAALARNVDSARREHASGMSSSGSLDELMADLHAPD